MHTHIIIERVWVGDAGRETVFSRKFRRRSASSPPATNQFPPHHPEFGNRVDGSFSEDGSFEMRYEGRDALGRPTISRIWTGNGAAS